MESEREELGGGFDSRHRVLTFPFLPVPTKPIRPSVLERTQLRMTMSASEPCDESTVCRRSVPISNAWFRTYLGVEVSTTRIREVLLVSSETDDSC